jgi:sugar/nucleoside kinase (ribokinase family)
MTEVKTGRRTFFHCQGANSLWDGKGLDFKKSKAKIFHIGYLLLLDGIDASDKKYGTRGAALCAKAQRAGLKTSIDCVSEDSDRFARIVSPILPYTDYCILNELEAGKTTGHVIRRKDGALDTKALCKAAAALLRKGVRELVCVHYPEGAYVLLPSGEESWQSSLKLPQKYIKGAAGAGDAFCAGMLLGIHEGWNLQRSLFTGVCAAAANLSNPTCTGGMKRLGTILRLAKKYKQRSSLKPGK